ncbi:MAG: 3-oxoacyl-ACP reductase family protein [Candidatus Bathyarchaeia archaeon]|jgi:NAD(P)-dependent dehydrogenase (short-subunit alcohol dehydrogenase family)
MKLNGKVAIVTGANRSRGMGRAIAIALAKEGADIVVTGRQEAPLETAKLIESLGRSALPIKLDVRSSEQVDKMVSDVVEKFRRVDVLVNGAGALVVANAVDTTEDEWDLQLDVNAKGTFLCCRAVAREMMKQKIRGKIVNISSDAGLSGDAGYAVYGAAKWGVIGFTLSLAKELGPFGINVNAVCPGDTDTDLLAAEIAKVAKMRAISEAQVRKAKTEGHPLGRFASPHDVANLVAFLASNDADYITGAVIKMN